MQQTKLGASRQTTIGIVSWRSESDSMLWQGLRIWAKNAKAWNSTKDTQSQLHDFYEQEASHVFVWIEAF
jgi:hypothetical protein